VFVVDDDASVREGLESLIRSAGHGVQAFGSACAFLSFKRPDSPSCLVLAVRMPGISGIELQDRLAKAGVQLPIIFITRHGDISDDGAGDESRRGGVSDQAFSRSGFAFRDSTLPGKRPRGARSWRRSAGVTMRSLRASVRSWRSS
jgi:CheY-like chemotaxis protein